MSFLIAAHLQLLYESKLLSLQFVTVFSVYQVET